MIRIKVVGAAVALALAGTHAPAPTWAQAGNAATQALATKIVKLYPWAKPIFTYATFDKKQFNLKIFETDSSRDLGQAIGARLMNLYVSVLPGQQKYTLTTYTLTTHGAFTEWQYKYVAPTRQLLRYHFVASARHVITSWYLTPGQIAQAAKAGHWPSNGVTL
jgi:hypothetical protein